MIRSPASAVAVLLAVALVPSLGGCGGGGPASGSTPQAAESPPPDGQGGTAGTGTDCAELANVFDRIVCYADLASGSGDRSRCDAAAEEAVRFQCYAIYAERQGDPESCRAIPADREEHRDLRDVCLADVAPVVERPEICEEVVAAGLRDSCYLNVFRATGDAALCDQIEDPGLKSACTGEPVYVDVE